MKHLPTAVCSLLEHKRSIFVGRSVWGADLKKLVEQYGARVDEGKTIELATLAKNVGKAPRANLSLKSLCRLVLSRDLSKDEQTNTVWTGSNLGKDKIQYAARDAWASLLIYKGTTFYIWIRSNYCFLIELIQVQPRSFNVCLDSELEDLPLADTASERSVETLGSHELPE